MKMPKPAHMDRDHASDPLRANSTLAPFAEVLMARADVALYEAKASGRDRACMSA